MEKRPFQEKERKPNEESLKQVLDSAFVFYLELKKITNSFRNDWNYSKSSGWIEKVSDSKKALYYLIPLNNSFTISMAIRESEKETLMADRDCAPYLTLISEAKKYHEGYNLRFPIEDEKSFHYFKDFIVKLIHLR